MLTHESEGKGRLWLMEEPDTLAEAQLRAARHDPRLDRGAEAMVADWRDSVAAIERSRGFLIFSVEDLHESLRDHEKEPRGGSHEDKVLWQRRALADAEMANGFAELNAMAIVALLGAFGLASRVAGTERPGEASCH